MNGVLHTYTLDGTKILRETWDSNTLIPLYDNEDSVCGILYNNVPYYFIKNLQGDVIAIVDKDAQTVARYTYDAWGVCTIVSDNTGIIARVNPFRYRSYYYDQSIGLYYLQSRYYDPQVGRFINADDIKYLNVDTTTVSQNLYCYCGNEPISRIDYFGSAWSIDSVLDKILTFAAKICEFILKQFNISDRKYKARNKYKNKKDLVNFVHENKSKIKKLGKTFNAINTFLQIVFTVIDCAKIIKNATDEVKGIAEVLFEGFKTLIQFLAKKLISFIITSVIKFLALVKWLIEMILDSIFDYILGAKAVSGFITNVKSNYLLNINSKDITFKMFILAFFKGVKAAV